MKNLISVTSFLVDGSVCDILENVTPSTAIEQYFSPDTRPPVSSLIIKARTEDGKLVTLAISPTSISATIE